MPERTSVTEVIQVGAEVTPGTSVAANRKLPSLSIVSKVKTNIDTFRTHGNKFPTIHALGKEWSESAIEGEATYSEIEYLLMSLLQYTAPAQQGATTAYKWAHAPSSTVEDVIKTLTVERGSSVRAQKHVYGFVSQLSLEGDRDNIDLSGSMMGRAIQDGITLTASPIVIEQIPMLPKEFDVFLDAVPANIGTTKLTRVLKWGIDITRWNTLWVVDSAQPSFVTHIENPIQGQVHLMLEADAEGMALLAAVRDGTSRYVRIKGTSAQLAGVGFPYSIQIDGALQVAEEPDGPVDENDVQVIDFTFDLTHDATLGKAISAEVINKQTAL